MVPGLLLDVADDAYLGAARVQGLKASMGDGESLAVRRDYELTHMVQRQLG